MPILIMVVLAIYFIPSIVAATRDTPRRGAIFALNLFLGWTLVGWVIALVWALAEEDNSSSAASGSPTSGEELTIELTPKSASPGPAWNQMIKGSPLKLIIDGELCTFESEFGIVATLKDPELLKRIAFRSDAQGKPRAKVRSVIDDFGLLRRVIVAIRFGEA